MHTLVVVKRYDSPRPLYGLHSNEPKGTLRKGVFWTVGLFSPMDLHAKLSELGPFEKTTTSLDTLISCAPIEWHTAMRNGEMLERFNVYTTH